MRVDDVVVGVVGAVRAVGVKIATAVAVLAVYGPRTSFSSSHAQYAS